MSIEMTATTYDISSAGLPVYRVQFLNTETGEVVSDVDIVTGADCVKYINENPIIKEGLGFKKGESVDTDLEKIVDALLYPYQAPEFVSIENISLLPDFGKYIEQDTIVRKEKGISVDRFKLSVTVMAGSKPLVRCSLIRIQNNTREIVDNRSLTVSPGQTHTVDFILPGFSNDTRYFFEISDNEDIIKSHSIDYVFALPIYVGYAKDGLLEPELPIDEINTYMNGIITQTDRVEKRLVEMNSVQTGFFDLVDSYVPLCPFILVPLKWNSLIKINDANGMDITKFFSHNNNILIKTNPNNTDYEGYVLYVAANPVDTKAKVRFLREITYTFAHDESWKKTATVGNDTEIITGFEVLTPSPIDSRFVRDSYDDISKIAKPYEGLIVYVKNIQTYYKYNGKGWEVTNSSVRLYNGLPSISMGGKMDISIDLRTGDVYQKTNSNIWELKGNLRGESN